MEFAPFVALIIGVFIKPRNPGIRQCPEPRNPGIWQIQEPRNPGLL